MKLLLNDKEIAEFLFTQINLKNKLLNILPQDRNLALAIQELLEKKRENLNAPLKQGAKKKFADKLKKSVERDLRSWVDQIKQSLLLARKSHLHTIRVRLNFIIDKLGYDNIIKAYINSCHKGFIKGTGLTIDPTATFSRIRDYNNYEEDCLLRNTGGNEKLLINKIKNNYPFWFIDSGYTNFLSKQKNYHRLVRNHLHYGKYFEAPVDRLEMFESFPQPWRTGGDKILIIEPGPFAAAIFGADLKTWKYSIESELRKYTDKRLVFRSKVNKKERDPLYKHLCNNDYYCVININSNAATESIWAGIPAITLDQHITNSITKNKLSDINNLSRPHLANWLCMLSYSQFTKEELFNGTAINLTRKYCQ